MEFLTMLVKVQRLAMADAEVIYYPQFFDPSQSQIFMRKLLQLSEQDWQQHQIKMFGKIIPEPHLSAFYGDCPYRYSGITRQPLPWHQTLLTIKQAIEILVTVKFNVVLLNFYRDGYDSMGWHSDDEKDIESPIIASVSLGATRKFSFRRKDNHEVKVSLDLADGDVLIMAGETQKFWQHQIPKTATKIASQTLPRINLTYRRNLPNCS
jgi:alkylated DNA repair dioxygenase AlkB